MLIIYAKLCKSFFSASRLYGNSAGKNLIPECIPRTWKLSASQLSAETGNLDEYRYDECRSSRLGLRAPLRSSRRRMR